MFVLLQIASPAEDYIAAAPAINSPQQQLVTC